MGRIDFQRKVWLRKGGAVRDTEPCPVWNHCGGGKKRLPMAMQCKRPIDIHSYKLRGFYGVMPAFVLQGLPPRLMCGYERA